jgi:hypothetical protein
MEIFRGKKLFLNGGKSLRCRTLSDDLINPFTLTNRNSGRLIHSYSSTTHAKMQSNMLETLPTDHQYRIPSQQFVVASFPLTTHSPFISRTQDSSLPENHHDAIAVSLPPYSLASSPELDHCFPLVPSSPSYCFCPLTITWFPCPICPYGPALTATYLHIVSPVLFFFPVFSFSQSFLFPSPFLFPVLSLITKSLIIRSV